MNNSKEWFKLNISHILFLSIYFTLLIFSSTTTILSLLIKEIVILQNLSILSQSIIGSIATAILGSSIFYYRKMYKACINLDFSGIQSTEDQIRSIGMLLYFLLRPVFSMCFALMLIILIKSGTMFITNASDINDRFIYICMLISFFVGYSSGDLLDQLEEKGKTVISKFTKE